MCCFSQPVSHVGNTRIFGRLAASGTQFLAYEMEYESESPTAMILPLPIDLAVRDGDTHDSAANDSLAGGRPLRFISLEGYPDFFSHFERGFPFIPGVSIGCSTNELITSSSAAMIEVQEIGDYIASYVPSLQDFDRLDPQFSIASSVWDQLPLYHDFGFAVFQLKKLSGKPHPMAMEFATRWPAEVFFPTVHIHDGEVHSVERFDHALYLQHAAWDSIVDGYVNSDVRDQATGFVRSNRPAKQFMATADSAGLLQPDLLVHRSILSGDLANEDQRFSISGDPITPTMNWNNLKQLLPWGIGAGALAWFLGRRSRLRRQATLNSKPLEGA
ncbi:hypothetical protein [Rubripirellula reticaptiva]|uniref:Uncharacterized protein n=1 Tax=Rubripirellula reticaptiva TaxID=2528013 RepID=A0A5C6F6X8_9BACT|nr:hypothetical protein [Rubripirellula reticaptiva]TWU56234.1 hypothetical protein Poly59_25380 [Rubripirellula reticaptiva]